MEPNAIMPADVVGWCEVNTLHDAQLIEDIWKVVRLVDQRRMALYRESQDADRGGKK